MNREFAAVTTDDVDTYQEADLSQEEEKLTNLDRCDRCGAQAFVRAVFSQGDLLFCGHHAARWEDEISSQALVITDERDRINMKPSISANAI